MGNLAYTKTSKLEKLRIYDKADDEEEYGDEAGGLTWGGDVKEDGDKDEDE